MATALLDDTEALDIDAIYSQKNGQQLIITNNNINNYIISNPNIDVTANVPQHALVATAATIVNFPQNAQHINGIQTTTIHPSQITPAPNTNGRIALGSQQQI